jgi:hypothetical protein
MNPDILIVRVSDGYRLLHGHLHLINALSMSSEISIDIQGQGKVTVTRTQDGLVVKNEDGPLPILPY